MPGIQDLHQHRTNGIQRINDKAQEQFEINEGSKKWSGRQDRNIEDISYECYGPGNVINSIHYTGWRLNPKYKHEGRKNSFEFNFVFSQWAPQQFTNFERTLRHTFKDNKNVVIKNLSTDSNPRLVVYLIENNNEGTPELESLFRIVTRTDRTTSKIIADLKDTLSSDCLYWFNRYYPSNSRDTYTPSCHENREKALRSLHHHQLEGVCSSLYLAAQQFIINDRIFAVQLLNEIPMHHWQYDEAQNLIADLLSNQSKVDHDAPIVANESVVEANGEIDVAAVAASVANIPVTNIPVADVLAVVAPIAPSAPVVQPLTFVAPNISLVADRIVDRVNPVVDHNPNNSADNGNNDSDAEWDTLSISASNAGSDTDSDRDTEEHWNKIKAAKL